MRLLSCSRENSCNISLGEENEQHKFEPAEASQVATSVYSEAEVVIMMTKSVFDCKLKATIRLRKSSADKSGTSSTLSSSAHGKHQTLSHRSKNISTYEIA